MEMQMHLGLGQVESVPSRDAAGRRLSLRERFEQFHEQNPQVFAALRQEALHLRRHGVHRWGIASLFERLRWLTAIETGGDSFRLNNDYRAFYARKLMDETPELAGFFEVRCQLSEEVGCGNSA